MSGQPVHVLQQARREQRMATQFEEVIVPADRREAKQAFPLSLQEPFELFARLAGPRQLAWR